MLERPEQHPSPVAFRQDSKVGIMSRAKEFFKNFSITRGFTKSPKAADNPPVQLQNEKPVTTREVHQEPAALPKINLDYIKPEALSPEEIKNYSEIYSALQKINSSPNQSDKANALLATCKVFNSSMTSTVVIAQTPMKENPSQENVGIGFIAIDRQLANAIQKIQDPTTNQEEKLAQQTIVDNYAAQGIHIDQNAPLVDFNPINKISEAIENNPELLNEDIARTIVDNAKDQFKNGSTQIAINILKSFQRSIEKLPPEKQAALKNAISEKFLAFAIDFYTHANVSEFDRLTPLVKNLSNNESFIQNLFHAVDKGLFHGIEKPEIPLDGKIKLFQDMLSFPNTPADMKRVIAKLLMNFYTDVNKLGSGDIQRIHDNHEAIGRLHTQRKFLENPEVIYESLDAKNEALLKGYERDLTNLQKAHDRFSDIQLLFNAPGATLSPKEIRNITDGLAAYLAVNRSDYIKFRDALKALSTNPSQSNRSLPPLDILLRNALENPEKSEEKLIELNNILDAMKNGIESKEASLQKSIQNILDKRVQVQTGEDFPEVARKQEMILQRKNELRALDQQLAAVKKLEQGSEENQLVTKKEITRINARKAKLEQEIAEITADLDSYVNASYLEKLAQNTKEISDTNNTFTRDLLTGIRAKYDDAIDFLKNSTELQPFFSEEEPRPWVQSAAAMIAFRLSPAHHLTTPDDQGIILPKSIDIKTTEKYLDALLPKLSEKEIHILLKELAKKGVLQGEAGQMIYGKFPAIKARALEQNKNAGDIIEGNLEELITELKYINQETATISQQFLRNAHIHFSNKNWLDAIFYFQLVLQDKDANQEDKQVAKSQILQVLKQIAIKDHSWKNGETSAQQISQHISLFLNAYKANDGNPKYREEVVDHLNIYLWKLPREIYSQHVSDSLLTSLKAIPDIMLPGWTKQ